MIHAWCIYAYVDHKYHLNGGCLPKNIRIKHTEPPSGIQVDVYKMGPTDPVVTGDLSPL